MLELLRGPLDLLDLDGPALADLAGEIRRRLVDTVGRTGGHLGSNLGVVELTLALHRVFARPGDRIVFDTGHQAYVHKMVTGRAGAMPTLRRAGGLSGYPSRRESPHDLVENSHASTALSYADGLAKAAQLRGGSGAVVAVVGDGALTGGMCWEALNNLGAAPDRPVVVVLNDNGRSYAPTAGALARHLAVLRESAPGTPTGSIFEALGFAYLGPVDGHDLPALESALRAARELGRPVVVHCVTRKGAGHAPAEADDLDRYHTVPKLDGDGRRPPAEAGAWTDVFADALVELASQRPDVVAVTAAMAEPTGLDRLARRRPGLVFDVGIAEQHGVTSAAGMAMAGLHPVVAIYATFLNRAFDQVLLDVALHGLPVTLVVDRAGVTGPDGASHHGLWDLALLQLVPGIRVAAPRDAATLREELREALDVDDRITAVRFPRGRPTGATPRLARLGGPDGVDVLRGGGPHPHVLLIGIGAVLPDCLAAADMAAAAGVRVSVVDPRWVVPVNPVLAELARGSRAVVTVEDGIVAAGVGAAIARALADEGVAVPVRSVGLPRRFLPHGERRDLLALHGLAPQPLSRVLLEVAGARPAHARGWRERAARRRRERAAR